LSDSDSSAEAPGELVLEPAEATGDEVLPGALPGLTLSASTEAVAEVGV